ncbi:SMP-30/gluconolactonase/LRE family protein [Cupriavidus sp. CuC1]|uniref:SMP-30/gluconolactonase/LRE family protein n=1 Tax=Cupriavidus sp. CuC1 TaxID=3373131 RepID=UPI0037D76D70
MKKSTNSLPLQISGIALALWALAFQAQAQAADQCNTVLVDAQPRVVASGFQYTEGPAWDPRHNRFVFSDIPANTVFGVTLDGKVAPVLKPSGYANGNAFDAAGNLWSARHDRKIGKTDAGGSTTVALELVDGKKLNSPNDLVVAGDGSVLFTDPPYGIQGYGPQRAAEEQPVRGVYRFKDGHATLLTGELTLPNGLAFSPDERLLYVGDTADGTVYRFKVGSDGQLTGKLAFAKIEPAPGQEPMVDGLKVDRDGNLWMAGPESLGVFSAEGVMLCKVDMPGHHLSNLAFGGKDGRDLLITYSDKVLALRSRVAGR